MAVTTVAGSKFTTTAGNKTVTATPAIGDLIVIIAPATGVATSAVTDNNNSGTYTKIGSSFTGWSTSGDLSIWVRNELIAQAISTTFTATQTSSTGGGMIVYRIRGVQLKGSAAVRSSGGQSSGTAATTPAPVLSNTPLTGNVVIAAVASGTNSTTTVAQRSGYTEDFDNGYATPTAGFEACHRDSGETSATLTFGGTCASIFASIAVEIDTSFSAPLEEGVVLQAVKKSVAW